MQDVRRLTISLPFLPRCLSRVPPFFPTFCCLSCFTEAASSDSTFRLFYFSPSLSLCPSLVLFPARCSETLRLLAGGLTSYADCASCAETAANLRQFVFGIAS